MKRQKPNINRKIDLARIAAEDGFPEFLKQLGGFGNYAAYTNGEKVRVYDPKTGRMVCEYKPRTGISPRFHGPEEHIPNTAAPIMATRYTSREVRRRYYKR